MSCKLILARLVTTHQVADFDLPNGNDFVYIEVFINGYTGMRGRNRVKRFNSLSRAFMYLNKMRIGGFMTDDEYTDAWRKMCDIEEYARFHCQSSRVRSLFGTMY